MSDLTLPELFEEMRLHAKSSVVNLEPSRVATWLAVLQASAMVPPLVYVSADSPTPALVEHVDLTLAISARVVELEVKLAELERDSTAAETSLGYAADGFREGMEDAQKRVAELEQEVARLKAEVEVEKASALEWHGRAQQYLQWWRSADPAVRQFDGPQSVTQEVAEANLERCGFCLESKPAAELVNGECADMGKCARNLCAQVKGVR